MSSRFVSGGTTDQPIERDEEWKKAQQEVEEAHLRKLKENERHGGKSLFEVLQANKAAKQDAFEESIRLKNQFRSLDEDEIDFLDKVMESTRAKEAEVKKETAEQLDAFRKQQEEAEKSVTTQQDSTSPPVEAEQWGVGRKRKKGKEADVIKGLKLRKTSSAAEDPSKEGSDRRKLSNVAADPKSPEQEKVEETPKLAANTAANTTKVAATPAQPKPVGLNLGGYSSDED